MTVWRTALQVNNCRRGTHTSGPESALPMGGRGKRSSSVSTIAALSATHLSAARSFTTGTDPLGGLTSSSLRGARRAAHPALPGLQGAAASAWQSMRSPRRPGCEPGEQAHHCGLFARSIILVLYGTFFSFSVSSTRWQNGPARAAPC